MKQQQQQQQIYLTTQDTQQKLIFRSGVGKRILQRPTKNKSNMVFTRSECKMLQNFRE